VTEAEALRRRLLWGSAVVTIAAVVLVVAGIAGWVEFTAITLVCLVACLMSAGFGWTRYVQLGKRG
jgi:hypothetical protein